MSREEILQKLESVCTPVLAEMGYRLIEWEFLNEQGRWIVRLFIDSDGGVTIEDCARASHALEDLIEVEIDMGRPYSLEVSSPGEKRPLRRHEDFERYQGSTIRLKTLYPVDGRSNYKGIIEDVTGDTVSMVVDGMRYRIPFEALKKANLEEDVERSSAKGVKQ
jgi:ribosome maturation factor RimP